MEEKRDTKLYTYDDVSEILGLSKSTIYRLVREGRLTPVKLTRRATRFLREDVEAYVAKHRVQQRTFAWPASVSRLLAPEVEWTEVAYEVDGVRLFAKDARHMDALADGEVNLVVTSPPYWNAIDYDQHIADSSAWYRTRTGDEYEIYLAWLSEIMSEVWRVSAPASFCAMVVGTVLHERKHYPLPFHLVGLMQDIGFQFHQDIIWHKVTGGVKRAGVTIQHPYPGYYYPNIMTEYILVFRKPGDRRYQKRPEDEIAIDDLFKKEVANTVWHIAPVPPNHLPHPCPFPEEIPYRLIQLYTEKGDLVLDPFMGIGTTIKVAKALGRKAVGYDIKREYVEEARNFVKTPLNLRDPLVGVFPNLSQLQQPSLFRGAVSSRRNRRKNRTRHG